MIYDTEDCCAERNGKRFRCRAGAIIIEDGAVLLVTNDKCGHYYTIGGGVHMGESAEQAVVREVKEEIGEEYAVDRLFLIHENFFTPKAGVFAGVESHELGFYFLMKPKGKRVARALCDCPDGRESIAWVPLERLNEANLLPGVVKEKILAMPSVLEHVVTYG